MNLVFHFLLLITFSSILGNSKVKVGAQILIEHHLDMLRGKRVGIVTNHSAVLADGRHIVDVLLECPGINVVALFGPEHGIRGDAPDGKSVEHGSDAQTGVKVYSLYGKVTKPTDEMLRDIDVMILDIQDVGVRFYTFISTLSLTLEAAAEHHIKYIVLDRPNPIRGTAVEGAVREDSLKSFVGLHPIPVAHGMTVGELATMFNGEGWLAEGVKADLNVMTMENWDRRMWYDETGLPWIKPSPNIMTLNTAIVYPGICFIEGTNVSEGRGTQHPFEYIGAPWINGTELANELNSYNLPGVAFEPIHFTPTDIASVMSDPKYDNQKCGGVFIRVVDRSKFEPVRTGIYVLYALKRLYPNEFKWRESRSGRALYVDKLTGTANVRLMLDAGKKPDEIIATWQEGLDKFRSIRAKYLLYD
jgi:uncharacterized protein YbbC (DUF1343 family)